LSELSISMKYILLILLTISVEHVAAQSLSNSSFGFSTGYLKSESGISLTVSAGEAVSGSFSNGEVSFAAPVTTTGTITPTSIESLTEVPSQIALFQNYPNPFNPTTRISFGLPQQADVSINVYNTIGSQVTSFKLGQRAAGVHQLTLDASTWASGVYVYTLMVDGAFHSSRKLMLIK
jgi:hypothetical protein